MSQDEEGQAILTRLHSGEEVEAALTQWLRARQTELPPQLSTYVSGGQVGKLITIGQARVVNIYPDRQWLFCQEYLNRQNLLKDVKTEIVGQLGKSIYKGVLLNPDKESQPEQVTQRSSWKVKVDYHIPLPAGTNIIEVFDRQEVAGRLLILGAPGAGKTTTLLELAKKLVTRAENNEGEPIPVLFNLSSWDGDQTIVNWLVAQLNSRYGVNIGLGHKLVENCQLLPLLDCLDELESKRQKRCVQAINHLLAGEQRPQYLIVCSRLKEYENNETLLQLNGAICLQSLTESQIHQYLINIDRTDLWQVIQKNKDLLELARTPLLLSIMNLAYPEKISLQEWQELKSRDERLQYLFNVYIKQMLKMKIENLWYPKGKEPTREKTLKWLSWLAKKEKKTEFLIENMQPSLLQTYIQIWGYSIGVSIIIWQVSGIVFVLFILLTIMWFTGSHIYTEFGLFTKIFSLLFRILLVFSLTGVSVPVVRLLVHGLSKVGMLCFSLIGVSFPLAQLVINGLSKVSELIVARREEIKLVDSLVGIKVSFKIDRIPTVRVDLSKRTGTNVKASLLAIIFCMGSGAFIEKFMGRSDGVVWGLFFGIFMDLNIRTEVLICRRLSNGYYQELIIRWKQVIARLFIGLIGGIFVGETYGLVVGLLSGIIFGTINGKFGKRQEPELISFWPISPFSTVMVSLINPSYEEIRVSPNQGIWRSALNARNYAVISGLIVGLITGLCFCKLSGGLITGLLFGGLIGGLIGGLFFGGRACIQHFTLRVILRLSGSIPWDYAQFLNYTTERMFLQRVGGRYKFIHDLLQKHFAALTPAQVKELSRIDA